MFKNLLIAFLVVVLSFKGANAEPIKIGVMLDLSKEYVSESSAFREGLELAVHQANLAGGVEGRPLKLIVEDTQYSMKEVASISKKLLHIDKVVAAFVGTYSEAMVAGPLFETAKVPLINLWDSAPEIEAIGEYVFGIGVWMPSSGEVVAKFAKDKLNAKSVAIVNTHSSWSEEVAGQFVKDFEANGGKVVSKHTFNPTDSDFRAVLTKIKVAKPDVLYAPVTDNINAFWLQVHRSQLASHRLTSDIISEELINNTKEAINGVYQSQAAVPNHPETLEMIKAYKNHFGKDCSQVFYTSLGYDGGQYLIKAMKEQGIDSESIKRGLYDLQEFTGASGTVSMSPEGSIRRNVRMFQIQDGQFVPVD